MDQDLSCNYYPCRGKTPLLTPAGREILGSSYITSHDVGIEGEIIWYADGYQQVSMAGDTETSAGDFHRLEVTQVPSLLAQSRPLRPAGKVQIVCKTCGSHDVMRDAWAEWDTDAQDWVLRSVFDAAYCESCDGETSLMEVPL